MSDTPEMASTENAQPAVWNFRQLLIAFFVTLTIHTVILQGTDPIGPVLIRFSWMFDGLVLMRILVALVLNEHGRGWLFYMILLYTSPIWISFIVAMF